MPKTNRPLLLADLRSSAQRAVLGDIAFDRLNYDPHLLAAHTSSPRVFGLNADKVIANLRGATPHTILPRGQLGALLMDPAPQTYSAHRHSPWFVMQWCTQVRVKRLIVDAPVTLTSWTPYRNATATVPADALYSALLARLADIGFRTDHRTVIVASADGTLRQRHLLIGRSDRHDPTWPNDPDPSEGLTPYLHALLQIN